MTPLTERLSALERVAKAATPGPWILSGIGNIPDIAYYGPRLEAPTLDEHHIAAFNPSTVLVLIAALREAQCSLDVIGRDRVVAAHASAREGEKWIIPGNHLAREALARITEILNEST